MIALLITEAEKMHSDQYTALIGTGVAPVPNGAAIVQISTAVTHIAKDRLAKTISCNSRSVKCIPVIIGFWVYHTLAAAAANRQIDSPLPLFRRKTLQSAVLTAAVRAKRQTIDD